MEAPAALYGRRWVEFHHETTKAFPLLIESEVGLSDFDLTRFLHASRCPLRSKAALAPDSSMRIRSASLLARVGIKEPLADIGCQRGFNLTGSATRGVDEWLSLPVTTQPLWT